MSTSSSRRGERLSGTYRANGGETWNLIARMTSGNDLDADKVRRANPGVMEPIAAGTLLQIPTEDLTAPSTVEPPSDTKIIVNGALLGQWDGFELARSIDAIGKASWTVPNETETRALFRPMSAPNVVISAGPVLLTGRCENPETDNAPDRKTLTVSAYSSPGILERCPPPIDAFPLEWTDSNLVTIANDLCLYHGVYCDFQADSGPLFKRVDIQPGGPVLDFLADLARQRGPVVSSSPHGTLLVWTGVQPGNPVSELEKGQPAVVSVKTTIDESRYYSSVTGTLPPRTKRRGRKDKGPGVKYTVDNPHATDQVRPFIAEFQDIDEGELGTAVEALAGRMFSAIVSVDVELSTWLNDQGQIYEPNTTLKLKSPEDFIETSYEFVIADVTLRQSANGGRTAALRCTIPGAYTGDIPEAMPWG